MDDSMKKLQLFYAAALSDAAFHYQKNGILNRVTEEKKQVQDYTASAQLRQLGIEDLASAYKNLSEIFGCAEWSISEDEKVLEARTSKCLLCAIARKQGSPQPCSLFCINPFSAYAEALGYQLDVKSTLWTGEQCLFSNRRK